MHEPRGKGSLALAYALSSTGANHTEGLTTTCSSRGAGGGDLHEIGILTPTPAVELNPDKVRQFTYMQYTWNLFNTLGFASSPPAPASS